MNVVLTARLSLMMFVQYLIWGSWAPTLGNYMQTINMGDSISVERTIPPLPYELVRDLGAFQRTMVSLDDNAKALIDTAAGAQG